MTLQLEKGRTPPPSQPVQQCRVEFYASFHLAVINEGLSHHEVGRWTGLPASSTRSRKSTRMSRASSISDLRAPSRRARVHRRLYHREGLCAFPAAVGARGFRSPSSPAGPRPSRLRRGGGGSAGVPGEGRLLLPDPAHCAQRSANRRLKIPFITRHIEA